MKISKLLMDQNYQKLRIKVFAIYLTILGYLVFIADDRYIRMKKFFSSLGDGNRFSCGLINLVPFKTMSSYFVNYKYFGLKLFMINLLGNVVVFIPFGILLASVTKAKNKFFEVLFYSVMLSTGIEAIQNLTRVGIFDIDDIILNTLGGIIGYFIYTFYNKKQINN